MGRCPRRSWQARPAGGDEADREASPGGPGLPPGGGGGEAALTTAGTAGSSQAGTRTQDTGEEAARSPTTGTAQAGSESPILGRGLPWSSRCLQIKGCCLLMSALLPPSFPSLVCHSAWHWGYKWE